MKDGLPILEIAPLVLGVVYKVLTPINASKISSAFEIAEMGVKWFLISPLGKQKETLPRTAAPMRKKFNGKH